MLIYLLKLYIRIKIKFIKFKKTINIIKDLPKALERKINMNAEKYPVEKCKGSYKYYCKIYKKYLKIYCK